MGGFVSYIVTECAAVAFYQNNVENACRPHSLYFLWCYSAKDKYDKDREKSS